MFKKNSKPLLFKFQSPRKIGIHSFFCRSFYAIWFNGERVVDSKLITNWNLYIIPKDKFDTLLEIPSNSDEFLKIADEGRNI